MQVFEPWTRLKPSRHLPVASQLLLPGQNSGFSWNPDPSVLSYVLSLFTNHQHKTLTCVLSVCQHVGSWKQLYDRNAYRARFIIFTNVIVCLFLRLNQTESSFVLTGTLSWALFQTLGLTQRPLLAWLARRIMSDFLVFGGSAAGVYLPKVYRLLFPE